MISDSNDFEQLNQRSLQELIVFLDFAKNLTIGFVEINWSQDAEQLLQILAIHPDCQEFQFLNLNFSQPDLTDLLSELEVALQHTQIKKQQKLVITLCGLENAIGLLGDYPPFLVNLNFMRDGYKQDMPYPILFILPSQAINRLAKFAPDFWAWRSGVFSFKTSRKTLEGINHKLTKVFWPDSLRQPEKQERIELLQQLLRDYDESNTISPAAKAYAKIEVLIQLGDAYLSQGKAELAMKAYQEVLIFEEAFSNQAKRAIALQGLGRVHFMLSDYTQATTYLQQALTTVQEIGDRTGESLILGYLGNVYDASGLHSEAIANYTQSLAIARELDNLWQVGSSLSNLGVANYYLGQYTQAIEFQRQVLEIAMKLGDRRGEGIVWSHLGNAYNALAQYQQAIKCHQQALEIAREVGDQRGERVALDQLGSAYYYLGQSAKALELYSQSKEIARETQLEPVNVWFS